MLVDEESYRPDPAHIFCLSMTEDEDRVLRELHKFPDGELLSNAGGSTPSLRKNLILTISADNLCGAIRALRNEGYVTTTLVTQADDWQHRHQPVLVRLTDRGRLHVVTQPPVSNRLTRVMIFLWLSGAAIAGLAQFLAPGSNYSSLGLAMAIIAAIVLLAKRAGKM